MNLNLRVLGAAALVAGGVGLASAAQAAPAGPGSAAGLAADGLIHEVAEGCGRGFFRGRGGFCRPMRGGYGPRAYGPRRFYGPRCVVRVTPFGPRRVCR